MSNPPFIEIAQQGVEYVEEEIKHGKTLADLAIAADLLAIFFFYLGDYDRGKKASFIHSLYREKQITNDFDIHSRIYMLFFAGLYRDLAQVHDDAQSIWERLVDLRRSSLKEEDIYKKWLGWRPGCAWVHEAYALTKLGRYREVAEPARIGHEAIIKKRGIDPVARKNSREFGLTDLLIELADYQLFPDEQRKKSVQKALQAYKQANYRWGRLGYGVIFDLQFTYPDIFTPVLPGPDPKKE